MGVKTKTKKRIHTETHTHTFSLGLSSLAYYRFYCILMMCNPTLRPPKQKQERIIIMPANTFFILVATFLVIPLLGYLLQKDGEGSLFSSQPPPPPDFGSGHMFDHIATRYDFINRVLALRMDVSWRKRMTKIVHEKLLVHFSTDPSPATPTSTSTSTATQHTTTTTTAIPFHILDVATGTADVALQLARDLPPDTIIWGVDPSVNMLQVGRQKVQQEGYSDRITLITGDARQLSSSSSSSSLPSMGEGSSVLFHAATMAFGIRNVPEKSEALCEIHSLLQPGGILAILEFSEPDDSHGLLGSAARLFIRHIVPIVGAVLSGAPREYAHLQNSIKDFPPSEIFQQNLQNLKCPLSKDVGDGHAFDMDDVIHMNFGSVQLYVGTAVKSPVAVPPVPPTTKQPSPMEFIQDEINHHDVVIFSKSYCPYCRAAKSLFRETLGVKDLQIHELDEMMTPPDDDDNDDDDRTRGRQIQDALLEWTGQRTVPNIFIHGQHLGGNDAAQHAHHDGTLATLLSSTR